LLKDVWRMRITGTGLTTIAFLTAILWGCLLVEHRTVAHARLEGYRALSEIRSLQLKKHILPAAVPVRSSERAAPEIS
jgi:hypothetical protein